MLTGIRRFSSGCDSDGLDGAHEIDQTAPLEVAIAAEVGRAVHEQGLHLFGLPDELPANGQERGDHARYVGRRHAGAALLEVVELLPREVGGNFFARLARGAREDLLTGS